MAMGMPQPHDEVPDTLLCVPIMARTPQFGVRRGGRELERRDRRREGVDSREGTREGGREDEGEGEGERGREREGSGEEESEGGEVFGRVARRKHKKKKKKRNEGKEGSPMRKRNSDVIGFIEASDKQDDAAR